MPKEAGIAFECWRAASGYASTFWFRHSFVIHHSNFDIYLSNIFYHIVIKCPFDRMNILIN